MDDFLREHWTTIVGGVVFLLLLSWVLRRLRPRRPTVHERVALNVSCSGCGWTGTVSRYDRKCRKCASMDVTELAAGGKAGGKAGGRRPG